MTRFFLAPLVLLILAGCGSLPHPFERSGPLPEASALTLPDAPGITIDPVAGAPEALSWALADSMVAALSDLDVPASVGPGNRASFRLSGRLIEGPPARVEWALTRPDGTGLGIETEVLTAPLAPVADKPRCISTKVAGWVGEKIGAAAPAPAAPKRQVVVDVADPAAPEAKATLASALRAALAARGFEPLAEAAGPAVRVRGELALTAGPSPGLTHVRLVWHVSGATGAEAARLTQENDVATRELPARWGFFAPSIAAATIDDLVAVLAKIDPGP